MGRYKGSANLSFTYNVTDYHPLDTRQLVSSFSDLTNIENWWTDPADIETSVAYNGMIVAVGNDAEYNGIYYLFDSKNPGEEDYPDVTKSENWHKLSSDINLDTDTLKGLLNELLVTLDSENYPDKDNAFKALVSTVNSNDNAISALVGTVESDKGKSVRAIAQEVVTTDPGIAALQSTVQSNANAIAAISSAIENLEINTLLVNGDEIDKDENNYLILTNVPISKLNLDVDLILSGGGAAINSVKNNYKI